MTVPSPSTARKDQNTVTYTIGYIVGSISSTSKNRRLAMALAKVAPEGVELVEIPIAGLPFYSPDQDRDFPPAAREFNRAIEAVDGVIIVTPQYNHSIPGVLKNALDWAARSWGSESFHRKPTAVIGASASPVGAAIAQQQVKAILNHFNAPVLGQPEAYIQDTPGLFAEDGTVSNEQTIAFLQSYLDAFTQLIEHYVFVGSARDVA